MEEIESLAPAIEIYEAKLREQLRAVARTKEIINDLCQSAGLPARYADVTADAQASSASIRGDTFHDKPLATAVREFLEMRKSSNLGPASPETIFNALAQGGYVFGKDQENAKRGLSVSLAKNSPTFYRLPNGEFGLRAWYNLKEPKLPIRRITLKVRNAARQTKNTRAKKAATKIAATATNPIAESEPQSGSGLGRAIGVIRSHGSPMNVDEIAAAIEAKRIAVFGMLARNAQKRDSLLRRIGKDVFGLAEWGNGASSAERVEA
jgi:hypothetical protein